MEAALASSCRLLLGLGLVQSLSLSASVDQGREGIPAGSAFQCRVWRRCLGLTWAATNLVCGP